MISWDGRSRNVVIDGQPVAAASVVRDGDGWTATIVPLRGVDLTLDAESPTAADVTVRLWKRPSTDGVGVAVVAEQGEPAGLAFIPICECGEQGCANAGRQLDLVVDGEGAHELIELARRLPLVGSLRPGAETWTPPPAGPR